jgi:Transcriptional activator, adenine-specific DNA methyltransferase
MKIDINNIDEKYGIIYTDPPWQQGKGGKKKARPNSSGGKLNYPTMPLQYIRELHRKVLENLTEEKHNVFMWTIDKYLIETQKFMEELGYILHARIVWNKVTGVAPAFTVRYVCEYLLWFYKKGDMLKPCEETRGKYSTVIVEKVKKHSQKPEQAYLMLEDMFRGVSKLELFARGHREQWNCWGNEV